MKLTNMTIMFVCMMVFITMMGIDGSQTFSSALGALGIHISAGTVNNSDITTSDFWNTINGLGGLLAILIGVGGTIIASLYGKSININLLILPMVTWLLANFGSMGWSIINNIPSEAGWLKAIVAMVFLPLMVMYIIAAVEFFFGVD